MLDITQRAVEMYRRRLLAGFGLTVTSPLAGCSGGHSGQSQPAYDRAVRLENRSGERRTVRVTVTHVGPAGTVYDDSHAIAPDAAREAYDFREAPTDGVETYEIAGELASGRRAVLEYATHRCMSDPAIILSEAGEIDTVHAEC